MTTFSFTSYDRITQILSLDDGFNSWFIKGMINEKLSADTTFGYSTSSEIFSKQRSYIEFGSLFNHFAIMNANYIIVLC